MLKVIKWVAVGSAALAAGGFLLFGSNAVSYVTTAASSIREELNDQIPVEFEIKRAERLIQEIEPQIQDGKRQVAQAEVDLERLQGDISRLQRATKTGETRLKAVTASLEGGSTAVRLASWERQRIESNLEREFESYKNNMALLKGKLALMQRSEQAVLAARQHLDAVRTEKSRLEDMIASLKTQKAQLDAMAASAQKVSVDDTALSRARDVLEQVKNRLDVHQRMLEEELFFESDAVEPGRDVVVEIQRFFSNGSDEAAPTVGVELHSADNASR